MDTKPQKVRTQITVYGVSCAECGSQLVFYVDTDGDGDLWIGTAPCVKCVAAAAASETKHTPPEHFTSIRPAETEHAHPDCGCRLTRDDDGRVKMYLCSMHESAPTLAAENERLRKALRLLLVEAQDRACDDADKDQHTAHESEAMRLARAVLDGAE